MALGHLRPPRRRATTIHDRTWDNDLLQPLEALTEALTAQLRAQEGALTREVDAWQGRVGPRSLETVAAEALLFALAAAMMRRLGAAADPTPLPSCVAVARDHLPPRLVEAAEAHCRDDVRMLGPAFERLIRRDDRYAQGQYFTPAPIARHMAAHLARLGCQTVLDPAAGAGVLLAAAADAAPGVELRGADLNPLCVHLTRAGLAARGVTAALHVADFLAAGGARASGDAGSVDAIICNPPYVRHHLLDKTLKKVLATGYGARLGITVSRLSSSYVYFLLEALERLRDGGALVFITPAEYLDVTYGQPIKALLSRRASLETLELFRFDELAFEEVLTTSAITIARKRAPRAGHTTRVREAVAGPGGVTVETERRVALGEVDVTTNWTLQGARLHGEHQALIQGRERRLGDYLRTRRGIATGANRFFVLTQQQVDAWGLEEAFLKPVLASARDLPDRALTRAHWERLRDEGRPVWLLDCGLPEEQLTGRSVARYLAHGRREGIHRRFTCRARTPWYRVEQVQPPDIIVTYMSRGKTRFVRNEAGCRVMSVFLNGFITDPRVDVDALLEVLNGDVTRALITQIGRTYGGGLGKIEPRELLRLPMPAL